VVRPLLTGADHVAQTSHRGRSTAALSARRMRFVIERIGCGWRPWREHNWHRWIGHRRGDRHGRFYGRRWRRLHDGRRAVPSRVSLRLRRTRPGTVHLPQGVHDGKRLLVAGHDVRMFDVRSRAQDLRERLFLPLWLTDLPRPNPRSHGRTPRVAATRQIRRRSLIPARQSRTGPVADHAGAVDTAIARARCGRPVGTELAGDAQRRTVGVRRAACSGSRRRTAVASTRRTRLARGTCRACATTTAGARRTSVGGSLHLNAGPRLARRGETGDAQLYPTAGVGLIGRAARGVGVSGARICGGRRTTVTGGTRRSSLARRARANHGRS
jgi:hypothetical protein